LAVAVSEDERGELSVIWSELTLAVTATYKMLLPEASSGIGTDPVPTITPGAL
jgi:hypothetical protein